MGMTASWCVLDADGSVVEEQRADECQPTASVGKVFLLCEIAERIARGDLDPMVPIERRPDVAVADSGLWQHLVQDRLPLVDACILIAAVSDNWATNMLLELVGLDAVAERAASLGCVSSGLRDRVRDARGPGDPPTLSTGTARELAGVALRIDRAATGHDAQGLSSDAARLVARWLRTGVDLSLVADAFSLDPLAHVEGALHLWNKTGWDTCVRADMGAASIHGESIAYAAIVAWDPGDAVGREAYDVPRALGARIAAQLRRPGAGSVTGDPGTPAAIVRERVRPRPD